MSRKLARCVSAPRVATAFLTDGISLPLPALITWFGDQRPSGSGTFPAACTAAFTCACSDESQSVHSVASHAQPASSCSRSSTAPADSIDADEPTWFLLQSARPHARPRRLHHAQSLVLCTPAIAFFVSPPISVTAPSIEL